MFIGCDPEIFLKNASGALVSAINRIGGTKEFPRPLEDLGTGFAVQEDNVALEFNIPAAENKETFRASIEAVMTRLLNEIKNQGLSFDTKASALFPEEELIDPRAQEFGCDPDFNAWANGRPNPKPHAVDRRLRSCGGHVHVGHTFTNEKELLAFIRRADLYLGVPSVLMDADENRRALYGGPGAFRYKPYGCEYRTLSNFWIFKSETINWVYDNTALALSSDVNADIEQDSIFTAIMQNNKQVAENLIKKYNIPYV